MHWMPRHLVLVKHSLPAIDRDRPPSRWTLSHEGRLRAAALADHLARFTPAVLYASPAPKTIETATIAAERLGVAVEPVAGLEEHARDTEPITTPEDFRMRAKRLFEEPDRVVFGTESATAARRRFTRALMGVVAGRPGGDLVVVSHGTVITLFVSAAAGVEPYAFWNRLGLPSYVVLALPGLEIARVQWQVETEGAPPAHLRGSVK